MQAPTKNVSFPVEITFSAKFTSPDAQHRRATVSSQTIHSDTVQTTKKQTIFLDDADQLIDWLSFRFVLAFILLIKNYYIKNDAYY